MEARMNRDELIQMLSGYEWNDLEVKQARSSVPKDAYETVSAFANTSGGHIIFGVKQADGKFEVSGVLDVDKVQNEFLSGLRSIEKISYAVDVQESMHQEKDGVVLVFFIPEARRDIKPVHLRKNISLSYIRKGACDHKCTPDEIGRFLRNASNARFDGQIIVREIEKCYDASSLKWYRERFREKNPDSSLNSLEDLQFLEHWGLVVEHEDKFMPTAGSILLFGAGPALRSLIIRPLADAFWHSHNYSDAQPDDRWLDRKTFEGNLVQAWKDMLDWYMQRRMTRFSIEPDTLERSERPEDYVSFREAALNLLTHQDFEESSTKATISFYLDRTIFRNLGHAIDARDALLKPGDKPVRNPLVVEAFRRVGIGERAGTGIRAIFNDWRRLGRVPPVIDNDLVGYEFRLSLLGEQLISERQIIFQASIGVRLTDRQASALALLCRVDSSSLTELSAAMGCSTFEVREVMGDLLTQVLAQHLGGERFKLAAHLRERWPLSTGTGLATAQARPDSKGLVGDQAQQDLSSLVSDQAAGVKDNPQERSVPPEPLEPSSGQRELLFASDTPRTLKELMEIAKVKHRANFRAKYLQPLVEAGLLQPQFPDRPTHPSQRYVLTDGGAKLVARWIKSQEGPT
jgi:ATP-dependent DNA helicase RecG